MASRRDGVRKISWQGPPVWYNIEAEQFQFTMEGKMLRNLCVSLLVAILMMAAAWPVCSATTGEGAFSIPIMAPLYGPPPIEFLDSWGITVKFRTTPEAVAALVPKPLVPNPDNIVYLTIQNLFAKEVGSYGELAVFVPATFEGKPIDFCVYDLASSEADNSSGREIWGFPQKEGTIKLEEKNGVVTGKVERGGIVLIRTSMALGRVQKPETEKRLPIVNLKLIPSVEKDAPPDVKRLTITTLQDVAIHRMYSGDTVLEFGASPVDPFQKIPIKEVISGNYKEMDFTIGYGKVLYDYLKAK